VASAAIPRWATAGALHLAGGDCAAGRRRGLGADELGGHAKAEHRNRDAEVGGEEQPGQRRPGATGAIAITVETPPFNAALAPAPARVPPSRKSVRLGSHTAIVTSARSGVSAVRPVRSWPRRG
jgi:hypothetical protein